MCILSETYYLALMEYKPNREEDYMFFIDYVAAVVFRICICVNIGGATFIFLLEECAAHTEAYLASYPERRRERD